MIWNCADEWQYDDRNNTDLPKVLKTLGQASASYTIPTTAQRIERVEIQDSSNNWVKLSPIDYKKINVALEEFRSTPALPQYYDLVGNYVTLYPAPSSAYVTLSSGMALRVSRDVTEFAFSATTETPGFATQFHRILSLSAAIVFEKDATQRATFVALKDRLEQGLQNFYSSREVESRAQMTPRGRRFQRQYE